MYWLLSAKDLKGKAIDRNELSAMKWHENYVVNKDINLDRLSDE